MKPHHCRYCGSLLRTWYERESHLDARGANGGKCKPPTAPLAPEEAERRKVLDRTFDMQKMRERAKGS